MQKNFRRILASLFVLLATVTSSFVFGQTVTFTGHHIEYDVKTSDGKPAVKVHYDANVKGCYGHTISIGVVFTTEDGKYLTDSNGNKTLGHSIQEIHYDNSNLNDRSFTVPISNLKLYSGRNTYYYQLYAIDKITGDYLGESDFTDFELTGKTNSNSSSNKTTSPKRSASFSDLRFKGGYNKEGKDAWIFYYDVSLKGCSGRKVKVQLTFKDANGNYLYGKNDKKLIWSQTFDVKSDNIKYTDQSFALTPSQLNSPSNGQDYYYQFTAYDDKTGDLLGQSEKTKQYFGDAVKFSQQKLTLDEYDNGKPVIKYFCHIQYYLPDGHDLKLVCALETDQMGHRHHYPDGREMIQTSVWKNEDKTVSGYLNVTMGFDHDEINPLPGKNRYWIRIYVYDANTGKNLGESGAFAFDAEDEGSNSNTTKSASSSSNASSSKASNSKASSSNTTNNKPSNAKPSQGRKANIKSR